MQADINTCVQMYMTVCEKNPLQTVESSCSSQKNILLFQKKLFFTKRDLPLYLSPGGAVAVFTATLVCHYRRTNKNEKRKLDSN